MSQLYTGTNLGKAGLEMTEVDGVPDVNGVSKITVSNGTLTDDGNGDVTLTTGGGGGGSGTVTSITNAADSGTGTAITAAGTFTYSGGTNITTSVTGTTVTFDNDNSLAAGVANEVAFYTAADAVGGDTGLTYVPTGGSRKLTLADSNAGTLFQIESTDAGGGSAPDMVMLRNSASPVAGDDLGVIVFKGNDDGGAEQEYARISAEANAVTAGTESGQIDLRVYAAGTLGQQLRVTETGVYINISNDAVTDFIVDTDTITNAFKVDASADTASFGAPLTTQDIEIDGALNHDGSTVGFYGEAPVVQGTANAYPAPAPLPPNWDPATAAAVDAELGGISASIGTIITLLTDLGLSA